MWKLLALMKLKRYKRQHTAIIWNETNNNKKFQIIIMDLVRFFIFIRPIKWETVSAAIKLSKWFQAFSLSVFFSSSFKWNENDLILG